MDLRASVEGGAQAIGVTTGVFTRADLEECGAGAPLASQGRSVFFAVHVAHRPFRTG